MSDNARNSSKTPSSSRSSRRRVPGSVNHGLSPAVSDLTNPASAASTRSNQAQFDSDVCRICDVPIAGLVANDPISPVKCMEPWDEEDYYDRHVCNDNPGTDDSEEEENGDRARAMFQAEKERCLDTEKAVLVDWADYIKSTQENKRNQIADNNLTDELEQLGGEIDLTENIPGAPVGWKRPGPKSDWTMAPPKAEKGEPPVFDLIDNPGDWPPFAFRPKFKTAKKKPVPANKKDKRKDADDGAALGNYLYQSLPIGATPVLLRNDKREVEKYEFHYQGWQNHD